MPDPRYWPDFGKRGGLLPAIVQHAETGEILMLASVNREAWDHTWATGNATFWSTSRQELWEKGATSGDWMKVVEVRVDCDDDAILYRVQPTGGACHTRKTSGETRSSCFYRRVEADGSVVNLDP